MFCFCLDSLEPVLLVLLGGLLRGSSPSDELLAGWSVRTVSTTEGTAVSLRGLDCSPLTHTFGLRKTNLCNLLSWFTGSRGFCLVSQGPGSPET